MGILTYTQLQQTKKEPKLKTANLNSILVVDLYFECIVFNIFYINYSGKKGWKYLINVKVPKMENVDWFIDKKKIQK